MPPGFPFRNLDGGFAAKQYHQTAVFIVRLVDVNLTDGYIRPRSELGFAVPGHLAVTIHVKTVALDIVSAKGVGIRVADGRESPTRKMRHTRSQIVRDSHAEPTRKLLALWLGIVCHSPETCPVVGRRLR